MKKLFFLSSFAFFSLFTSLSHAALPPMAQSLREMNAIINHNFFLSPKMIAENIISIHKTELGFILETTHFVIPIQINYLPQEMIGPRVFEVHFDTDHLIAKE